MCTSATTCIRYIYCDSAAAMSFYASRSSSRYPCRMTVPHHSQHGFNFNEWITHGVSFLSRADEAVIEAKLKARWVRDAAAAVAAAAEKEAAAAVDVAEPQGKDGPEEVKAADTARDGTTLESLDEAEQAMILDARKKVQQYIN